MSLINLLLANGVLPDAAIRFGIRRRLAETLRTHVKPSDDEQRHAVAAHVAELRNSPIAIETEAANEQHYEVDARFYGLCLGPRRKYSACFFAGAEAKWPGNELQGRAARLLRRSRR